MGDEADWAAEQYDDEYRERFWARMGRRPPPGPPFPRGDWFNTILYDAAAIKRGVVGVDKAQLRREVARHREKLERAEARLEALEGIPDGDPFQDGTVLRINRKINPSGTTWTFACLRAGGFWYTTGRSTVGLIRADWARFVDWLLEGGVSELEVMVPTEGSPHRLADLPDAENKDEFRTFLIQQCPNAGYDHGGHVWTSDAAGGQVWCVGFH